MILAGGDEEVRARQHVIPPRATRTQTNIYTDTSARTIQGTVKARTGDQEKVETSGSGERNNVEKTDHTTDQFGKERLESNDVIYISRNRTKTDDDATRCETGGRIENTGLPEEQLWVKVTKKLYNVLPCTKAICGMNQCPAKYNTGDSQVGKNVAQRPQSSPGQSAQLIVAKHPRKIENPFTSLRIQNRSVSSEQESSGSNSSKVIPKATCPTKSQNPNQNVIYQSPQNGKQGESNEPEAKCDRQYFYTNCQSVNYGAPVQPEHAPNYNYNEHPEVPDRISNHIYTPAGLELVPNQSLKRHTLTSVRMQTKYASIFRMSEATMASNQSLHSSDICRGILCLSTKDTGMNTEEEATRMTNDTISQKEIYTCQGVGQSDRQNAGSSRDQGTNFKNARLAGKHVEPKKPSKAIEHKNSPSTKGSKYTAAPSNGSPRRPIVSTVGDKRRTPERGVRSSYISRDFDKCSNSPNMSGQQQHRLPNKRAQQKERQVASANQVERESGKGKNRRNWQTKQWSQLKGRNCQMKPHYLSAKNQSFKNRPASYPLQYNQKSEQSDNNSRIPRMVHRENYVQFKNTPNRERLHPRHRDVPRNPKMDRTRCSMYKCKKRLEPRWEDISSNDDASSNEEVPCSVQSSSSEEEFLLDGKPCPCCVCMCDTKPASRLFSKDKSVTHMPTRLKSGGSKVRTNPSSQNTESVKSCTYVVKNNIEKPKSKKIMMKINPMNKKNANRQVTEPVFKVQCGEMKYAEDKPDAAAKTASYVSEEAEKTAIDEVNTKPVRVPFWKFTTKKKSPPSAASPKRGHQKPIETKRIKSAIRSKVNSLPSSQKSFMETKKAKTRISFKDETKDTFDKISLNKDRTSNLFLSGSFNSHNYLVHRDLKITAGSVSNSQTDFSCMKCKSKKASSFEGPQVGLFGSKLRHPSFICYDNCQCLCLRTNPNEVDEFSTSCSETEPKSECLTCKTGSGINKESGVCSCNNSLETIDIYSRSKQNKIVKSDTDDNEIGLAKLKSGKCSCSSCFCALKRKELCTNDHNLKIDVNKKKISEIVIQDEIIKPIYEHDVVEEIHLRSGDSNTENVFSCTVGIEEKTQIKKTLEAGLEHVLKSDGSDLHEIASKSSYVVNSCAKITDTTNAARNRKSYGHGSTNDQNSTGDSNISEKSVSSKNSKSLVSDTIRPVGGKYLPKKSRIPRYCSLNKVPEKINTSKDGSLDILSLSKNRPAGCEKIGSFSSCPPNEKSRILKQRISIQMNNSDKALNSSALRKWSMRPKEEKAAKTITEILPNHTSRCQFYDRKKLRRGASKTVFHNDSLEDLQLTYCESNTDTITLKESMSSSVRTTPTDNADIRLKKRKHYSSKDGQTSPKSLIMDASIFSPAIVSKKVRSAVFSKVQPMRFLPNSYVRNELIASEPLSIYNADIQSIDFAINEEIARNERDSSLAEKISPSVLLKVERLKGSCVESRKLSQKVNELRLKVIKQERKIRSKFINQNKISDDNEIQCSLPFVGEDTDSKREMFSNKSSMNYISELENEEICPKVDEKTSYNSEWFINSLQESDKVQLFYPPENQNTFTKGLNNITIFMKQESFNDQPCFITVEQDYNALTNSFNSDITLSKNERYETVIQINSLEEIKPVKKVDLFNDDIYSSFIVLAPEAPYKSQFNEFGKISLDSTFNKKEDYETVIQIQGDEEIQPFQEESLFGDNTPTEFIKNAQKMYAGSEYSADTCNKTEDSIQIIETQNDPKDFLLGIGKGIVDKVDRQFRNKDFENVINDDNDMPYQCGDLFSENICFTKVEMPNFLTCNYPSENQQKFNSNHRYQAFAQQQKYQGFNLLGSENILQINGTCDTQQKSNIDVQTVDLPDNKHYSTIGLQYSGRRIRPGIGTFLRTNGKRVTDGNYRCNITKFDQEIQTSDDDDEVFCTPKFKPKRTALKSLYDRKYAGSHNVMNDSRGFKDEETKKIFVKAGISHILSKGELVQTENIESILKGGKYSSFRITEDARKYNKYLNCPQTEHSSRKKSVIYINRRRGNSLSRHHLQLGSQSAKRLRFESFNNFQRDPSSDELESLGAEEAPSFAHSAYSEGRVYQDRYIIILREWLFKEALPQFLQECRYGAVDAPMAEYASILQKWLTSVALTDMLDSISKELQRYYKTRLTTRNKASLLKNWFELEGLRVLLKRIEKHRSMDPKHCPTKKDYQMYLKQWLESPGIKSMFQSRSN